MGPVLMRILTALRKARARLRREGGYTLVELIVVLLVLSIVLTPIVTSFTSAMAQEVDQNRREQAYGNARIALQRLRVDIHCATGLTAVQQNSFGGFTLTLTENDSSKVGWCPAVIPSGTATTGVQWCTIPYSGSPTRFVLYRFLGVGASACDGGAGSTFEVDYLAATPGVWPTNTSAIDIAGTALPTTWVGNLWPTSPTCATGTLRTLAIDFNVAVDPVNFPNEHYELKDTIALRNTDPCP
jgi:prepilin-type N-terminal cleavage/methylation domain-containing protein